MACPYVATASIGHLADLRRKVAKAKAIRGMRFITLLIPCLDGWGVADDGALTTARHAVESGAFPLYEIEDGRRYTLNHTERSCTLSSYLSLQRRYRHLTARETDRQPAGRHRRGLGRPAPAHRGKQDARQLIPAAARGGGRAFWALQTWGRP